MDFINNFKSSSKPEDVYNRERAACCFFYDYIAEPIIVEERRTKESFAIALRHFLQEMGLSFDEFNQYIKFHSFGRGKQYMHDAYEMNLNEENLDNNMDDNFMDF